MTSPNPAIRPSRRGGGAKFTWEGATVLKGWLDQIGDGMDDEAEEIEADLKGSIHVVSGEMRDKAYARVEVRGTKRTIVAGSTAPHTFYEEVAPNSHPVIRSVIDKHSSHLTQRIAQARRGGSR